VEAERALAAHFGYESCLILGSGFLANLTLIATMFTAKDTLALDKRAHASTVAGVRHSGAAFHTFRHNRLGHLERILRAHPVQAVLTESLFSMDGDGPDFGALARLKDEYGLLCVVDEAHAFGVLGDGGRGLARIAADVAVGTLGKAFGLFGAFILCPQAVRDHLLHFGQGFIYTTALPPWHGDMVLAMLERVVAADEARERLRQLGDEARTMLGGILPVRGEAHILALEAGGEARCARLAAALRSRGVLAFAARYPTVPLGQAILRVNLTSLHTREHVRTLRDALVASLGDEA
jgi:8-amino-7-oxononanoate synthase